jgi:hypothetical protein
VQYNTKMSSIHYRSRTIPVLFFLVSLVYVTVLPFFSCSGVAAPAAQSPESVVPTASETSSDLPGESRRTVTGNVRFTAAAAMKPSLPSAVGAVSTDLAGRLSASDSAALTAAFRDAYVEAVFRGVRIEGALGGDRVNRWLTMERGAYAQNWRSGNPTPNSWGLPSLIIASRPIEGDRVFVVSGAVLDAYGRGEGVGEANGVAGYGAPVSDEFSYENGVAQRFARGLMTIAEDGARGFLQEKAPSAAIYPSDRVGSLDEKPPLNLTEKVIRAAFRSAWTAAVDRGVQPAEADGTISAVVLPAAELPSQAKPSAEAATSTDLFTQPDDAEKALSLSEPVRVESVLIQTYGNSAWALALPIGEGIGLRARFLESPILDLLLFEGSWKAGFTKYGVPLTDPFPREGKTAQRFSAGWIEAD